MRYRIKLRLNSNERTHQDLIRLIDEAIAMQNSFLQTANPPTKDILVAIENAAECAQPLLKKEWERVKRGERPFRIVRNTMLAVISIATCSFVWFLFWVRLKP